MPRADCIVHPQFLVPVVPQDTVLHEHSVVVINGRIDAILPRAAARVLAADEHIELPHHALLPGLVNAHGHAAMTLLRGFADDYPLMTWLQSHIWPAEQEFVSEGFVTDGVDLACAELLLGGTTTFSDMYFFPDVTASRAEAAGLRAQLMFPVIDVPTAWARNTEEYLAKGLGLLDRFRGSDLVEIGFGPHANYTVSEATLERVATLANELDAPVQIHLHETRSEVLMSVENIGERPIDQLDRIGLLGPRTQCVHMTALGSQDIETVARAGAHVVHCPRSNMKLASGICPVAELQAAGVNVALGTDGAASNNRLNMLAEMQTAALLAKVGSEDPTALGAVAALEMATLAGARALGMADNIGSLEPGKAADMIAVALDAPASQPLNNVISHIVYALSGSEVRYSWVAGRALVRDGELTTLSPADVRERAAAWQRQLAAFTVRS